MKSEEIKFLKSLKKTEWFDIIERVLNYKSVPHQLGSSKETSGEFLIYLNSQILLEKEIDVLSLFHNCLLEYYFNLAPNIANNESIYSLHFVFSSIKPKSDLVEKLEIQLTSEAFKNQFYDNISLHSSLLALLLDLEIVNKDRIRFYINQCDYSIQALSFLRVSLRFFIKNGFINEYFYHFHRIANIKNKERLPELLGKSLLELRDYLGSFYEIYWSIVTEWSEYSNNCNIYNDVLSYIDRFLNYENEQFCFDLFAKLLKCHIEKEKYLFPPYLINDILNSLDPMEDKTKLKWLSFLKKYFRINIECFDSKREKLFLDDFDEKFFYFIFPENIDLQTLESNFRLSKDVLLKLEITKDKFNLLCSFRNIEYDELARKEKLSINVEYDNQPLYYKLAA